MSQLDQWLILAYALAAANIKDINAKVAVHCFAATAACSAVFMSGNDPLSTAWAQALLNALIFIIGSQSITRKPVLNAFYLYILFTIGVSFSFISDTYIAFISDNMVNILLGLNIVILMSLVKGGTLVGFFDSISSSVFNVIRSLRHVQANKK